MKAGWMVGLMAGSRAEYWAGRRDLKKAAMRARHWESRKAVHLAD